MENGMSVFDIPDVCCKATEIKIGASTHLVRNIPTWEGRFARLAELGFDAMDYNLCDIQKPWYQDVAEMERVCRESRAAAEKYGIDICQIHGPWPTNDTTPESREIVWDCMHRAVYACHLLGSKYMVIHPQMPFGFHGDDDPDFAENLTIELMKDLLPDCEKYGVTLCLENMPFTKQRISPTDRIVEAVEKVNSPYVGVCYDVGHSYEIGEDITESIRRMAPYLKVLHIHDNNGRQDDHLIPLLRKIDWEQFVKALADNDYKGVLSLEVAGVNPQKMSAGFMATYQLLAAESAKQLRQMLEKARNGLGK